MRDRFLFLEQPILLSSPTIRSIFEGRQTQIRRLVKPQPSSMFTSFGELQDDPKFGFGFHDGERYWKCPYGRPGDRLWVKETFAFGVSTKSSLAYKATSEWQDFEGGTPYNESDIEWKPAVYMKRQDSRIFLEITGVRVERLHDISEEDAKASGIEYISGQWKNYTDPAVVCQRPIASFRTLWESVKGHGSWEKNPWVWVIEFKRIKP